MSEQKTPEQIKEEMIGEILGDIEDLIDYEGRKLKQREYSRTSKQMAREAGEAKLYGHVERQSVVMAWAKELWSRAQVNEARNSLPLRSPGGAKGSIESKLRMLSSESFWQDIKEGGLPEGWSDE